MGAFDYIDVWQKSKVYIDKAIEARDNDDAQSYHLWAAVALELLGKSSLVKIHPVLMAAPDDFKSLFYACGIKEPTSKRSITARTVYDRLQYLSIKFDASMKSTCLLMSERRNAELHSGELPTLGLDERAWVPAFWRAVTIILEIRGRALAEWVGPEEAGRVSMVLADNARLREQAVLSRLERRKKDYDEKYLIDSEERQEAKTRADARSAPKKLSYTADELEEVDCPACGCKAWLLGFEWTERIIDEFVDGDEEEGYYPLETVETSYVVDAFSCPECGLVLNDTDEIKIADLPEHFERHEVREGSYEEEYGNE